MAVNYFGSVRMVLALLPHWRERRFGHVVNVSSAGVQASSPKYSAYIPSKAALDAFAEVVGTETLSDHITFTSIHMPLVETPMIAPSRRLNPMPADHRPTTPPRWWCAVWSTSPRGSTPRSARWPTSACTSPRSCRAASCTRSTSATRTRRRPAAIAAPEPSTPVAQEPTRRPKRPARAAATSMRAPRPLKRAVRLIPGVHW